MTPSGQEEHYRLINKGHRYYLRFVVEHNSVRTERRTMIRRMANLTALALGVAGCVVVAEAAYLAPSTGAVPRTYGLENG